MKIYAIGDVHGCIEELKQLLLKIDTEIKDGDEIVFIGDYIDRGPNSKGVVDLIIERQNNHPNKHITLKGNHEDMMIEGMDGWSYNGGKETLESYATYVMTRFGEQISYYNYWQFLPPEHKEFYKTLPLFYRNGKYVFVHAGIDPELSLENQTEQCMLWERQFVGYRGEYKDGYTVTYGHTPLNVAIVRDHQFGIDTACVFGGKLTAVVIDTETDKHYLLDVKAERNYRD